MDLEDAEEQKYIISWKNRQKNRVRNNEYEAARSL